MATKQSLKYLFFLLMITTFIGCDKEKDWLDIKSNKQSVVPETLKDFQALLDDPWVVSHYYSFYGNISTDNYFVKDEDLGTLREHLVNIYKWEKEINWRNGSASGWSAPYKVIAYSNLVIEGLENINPSEQGYNNVLGQAYFYRAFAYLNLSQLFCKPYQSATAQNELGLPIKLSSDVSYIQPRSTLEELYKQIIEDAEKSLDYVDDIPKYIQRPSKPAANALLARIHLLMGNFEKAGLYADNVLKTKSDLIDFNNTNQVSHNYAFKFPEYGKDNPEILFYVFSPGEGFDYAYKGDVIQANESLYSLYGNNDLRKEYFFDKDNTINKINFVSSYTGLYYSFGGLAINEILLIRAECLAREGRIDEALRDLNRLLVNRYKEGTFIDYEINDQKELIKKILQERRKELANVGNIRWEDLRRLNLEEEYQITLHKVVNGETFTLSPNDKRYVLSIPQDEINFSKIEQNTR